MGRWVAVRSGADATSHAAPGALHTGPVVVLTLAVAVLVVLAGSLTAVAVLRRRGQRRDPVTGGLLRAGFVVKVADALRRREPHHHDTAVAVVDFGILERVTETLGHARGEVVMHLLFARLHAACRQAGTRDDDRPGDYVVGRLVRDTFALGLPGFDGSRAARHIDALRSRLSEACVVDGLPFEVPVVVGVAATDEPSPADSCRGTRPDDTVATLLHQAEVALGAARHSGLHVVRYDAAMGVRAARRRALIRGFADAVANGQVHAHYQPLVRLEGRTVLGVEALARWEHPELGSLLPDEFVPVLESTGQIGELTSFVLGEALAAARRWLDQGLRLSVAVNVPVADLTTATFPVRVADALDVHRVPAELLTIELTESGVAADREAARPVLAGLHALGCRLAVDDFGTGQSSLAHLRGLPVDQVKIDKSFVLGMETERGDSAVVRAIVEMGHTLGMTVVAEGVEQPAVRAALVEMGCDVAQGYLVSRPLPEDSLDRWLAGLDVAPGPVSGGGPLTLIA